MNFIDNTFSNLLKDGDKNNFLENFIALFMQRWDTEHVNIMSVQILKKHFHPFDHDFML